MTETGELLRNLLMTAWLLPLAGFVVEIFFGFGLFSKNPRHSKGAAWCAVGYIGTGFVCSLIALLVWVNKTGGHDTYEADKGVEKGWMSVIADHNHGLHPHGDGEHAEHSEHEDGDKDHAAGGEQGHEAEGDTDSHDDKDAHAKPHNEEASIEGGEWQLASVTAEESEEHSETEDSRSAAEFPTAFSGRLYTLGEFGSLIVSLDYYIDSLTIVMFAMVTLIATCIHLFAIGYMSDELTDDYVDHFAHTSDGKHVHRPGRFYRFFAFLSLFCFSMLGLVLAGNIFQVFVFWELVGICSFLLIGFYTERKSASDAANKAFIMNRVGDFGFLIGLMVLWTYFGTFNFADINDEGQVTGGLFSMISRSTEGEDLGNVRVDEDGAVLITSPEGEVLQDADGNNRTIPYALLVVAGLGVFGGCIGKSAQFPLQTWLPDAMEGPTPVSALVHSATMVAAGVYLTGRFYPMFTAEVLLTIAYIGGITLFVAATIAIVATDIKKVLAYSTISQLGYMMLGLGVFGWAAGLLHLITHAFFKSLMFLCSGSVIHGCHHEQEMPKMGGLLKKMPITAICMLIGVLAIAGCPLFLGLHFSGYHSKDAIVASALAFSEKNPGHFLLFALPLITAGITSFYMFRLWFMTFWGKPRDQHVYDHAHESPWIMCVPLLILAPFAWLCAYGGDQGDLYVMLTKDAPAHIENGVTAVGDGVVLPEIQEMYNQHEAAGLWALTSAGIGFVLAFALYGMNLVNLDEMKKNLGAAHGFLANKWHFDDLYDGLFMRPAHKVAAFCAWVDRTIFDTTLHFLARLMVIIAQWDRIFDEKVVDGFVNLIASATGDFGERLRVFQTGRVRQYVMFIVVGVVILFAVVFSTFPG